MIEIRNLFREGGSPADLRYKEEERKTREIAQKTAHEEYTLDWSQSKVFLVWNYFVAARRSLVRLFTSISKITHRKKNKNNSKKLVHDEQSVTQAVIITKFESIV